MAIDSNLPEIVVLQDRIEARYGSRMKVHADFVSLCDEIFGRTKEHISETTLERLWNYSTRGYRTVSLRTLDLLCRYIGVEDWGAFLQKLKEEGGVESDYFDHESLDTDRLEIGDRIRLGWKPDRECIFRYLGDSRFVAEETRNSKMLPGDTFYCRQFQLHSPLYLERFLPADGSRPAGRYGIGLTHGLTMLQKLK